MRRWSTLAGIVLAFIGAFVHVPPLVLAGFALILLQGIITIFGGGRKAKVQQAQAPQGALSGRDGSK
jgi:hypothetical protein